MLVNVITPVAPDHYSNLTKLYPSIYDKKPRKMTVKWYIVADGTAKDMPTPEFVKTDKNIYYYNFPSKTKNKDRGLSGNPQRNYALSKIKDGLVLFLDADNILHHAILDRIKENLTDEYNKGMVVGQVNRHGQLRLGVHEEMFDAGHIDSAQVVLPAKWFKNEKWDDYDYCADGTLMKRLLEKHGIKSFVMLQEAVSYYNYLLERY